MDLNNYNLGRYIAYAYHDPEHYPTEPFLTEKKKSAIMSNEEMDRVMRLNTIKLGGKIKWQ